MILLHSWIVTTNRYPPTSAIKWVRKTPKKSIHPLVDEHGSILQAIGAVLFSTKPTFCSLPSHPNHHPTQASPNQAPTIKIAEKGQRRVCRADFFKISLAHILRISYLCTINCRHTVNRVLQFGCWSGSFALPTITQNLSVRSLKFSTIRHFFCEKILKSAYFYRISK